MWFHLQASTVTFMQQMLLISFWIPIFRLKSKTRQSLYLDDWIYFCKHCRYTTTHLRLQVFSLTKIWKLCSLLPKSSRPPFIVTAARELGRWTTVDHAPVRARRSCRVWSIGRHWQRWRLSEAKRVDRRWSPKSVSTGGKVHAPIGVYRRPAVATAVDVVVTQSRRRTVSDEFIVFRWLSIVTPCERDQHGYTLQLDHCLLWDTGYTSVVASVIHSRQWSN